MKVSSEWLQQYLGKKLDAKLMAESLELAGVEIEQIEYANRFHPNLVVGLIKKVMQHPGADRLHLVLVEAGEGEVEVVCGANNLYVSQKVAFATPGTVLPDGTKITQSKIRGQVSNGMLCSAMELGLGEDHSGIIDLPADSRVGKKLCDLWPESAILDMKSAANRSDLTSVVGLAREIGAFTKTDLELPELADITYSPHIPVDTSKAADRYMMAEMSVDNSGTSPTWLQQRLVGSGVRPISPIVDIGNYVMLELGQPLHIFDADLVKLPMQVRKAKPGEKLKTLDGVERTLYEDDLVICDASGVLALAGVMGGETTEVSAKTKRILIESATFDGVSVRKTAVRHSLRTEGSARFERRLPVQLAPVGLARAVQLYGELAGGKLAGASDYMNTWPWIQHVGVRPSVISKLFGMEISADSIVKHLRALEFHAEKFDIEKEAKKHIGRPYVWGAKYKTHGVSAFDCSYLVDYIYSLVGVGVGHTAHQQYKLGREVGLDELQPGDVLFRGGPWDKASEKEREGVSHDAIYIGNDKVVEAADYERVKGAWHKRAEDDRKVMVSDVASITKDPQYLGARRYVENLDDMVAVTAPWWRPDIRGEHDILEEVARLEGYAKVPARLPVWRPHQIEFNRRLPKEWDLRSIMRAAGLYEVMTYSFVSAQQLKQTGQKLDAHLKLSNPMSVEQAYLRSSMLPSLLTATARNEGYGRSFGIYELSKVFVAHEDHRKLPIESGHLAVLVRDPKSAYKRVKSVLDTLAREWNVELRLEPKKHDQYYPGRSAEVSVGTKLIGMIGEVHPDLTRDHKISGSVGYMELDMDILISAVKPKQAGEMSRFPAIVRDVSVVIGREVTWQKVSDVLSQIDGVQVGFVGDYYGPELGDEAKSLTLKLTMQEQDRTLTDAEADKRVEKIVARLSAEFDAKQR